MARMKHTERVSIEEEIQSACSSVGELEQNSASGTGSPFETLLNGAMVCRFREKSTAAQCAAFMHGRWFDERQLVADFLPETKTEPPPNRAVLIHNVFDATQVIVVR